ncbi:MAG: T9SS type A sorting domain-containing protein [Ferruginibacter sp.]
MKFRILLSTILMFAASGSFAQKNNIAYAITGDGNNDFVWMNIRQVDLTTGQVGKTIFQHNKTHFLMTDVATKKSTDETTVMSGNISGVAASPTATFVAAAAYDKRSNKLFFAPMRSGELRWVDLNIKKETPEFYTLSSSIFAAGDMNDEANHITRMVIAADGNGYAVTNDANHLIKFTTGKKPVITDLGNLVDAEQNSGLSIHNKCSSWGGDMVADAFGKLYIITASRNVFVVDISTRVASFTGTISGLPGNYTTNGAAVDAGGNIVVSSANVFEGYYKLKLDDLKATKIEGSDKIYNASDLANGNLLLQKEADAANKFTFAALSDAAISANSKIFPNPVTASSFRVLLDGYKEGFYTVILTDIAGRALQSNKVNIIKGQQFETVNLVNRPSKGIYMVKVMDAQKQIIFTEKVMIQ